MDTTATDHFTITSQERSSAPDGRDWGSHHWDFTITGRGSGVSHTGVFSAGSATHYARTVVLHRAILDSVRMDEWMARKGEGNMRTQLEALEDEGSGYSLPQAYDVATAIIKLHGFIVALTDDERDALKNDDED